MVPTLDVLNRYIWHERRDYLGRVAAAARGEVVPRTLPSIDTAVVSYHRFLLDPGWVAEYQIVELILIKPWSGEPTT